MADQSLIVPVVLPSGSLHFATVPSKGTVEDVVEALIVNAEITSEILGGLQPNRWALQKIRTEHNGRQWEEDELEALDTGILPPDTLVAPLLNTSPPNAEAQRHFSAFPLTSHLHTPTLRLVSLHPLLTLRCTFLRVPEIHDGFQWALFLTRSTNIRGALDAVIGELGLTKSLPVPGGGQIEYVFEEVWKDGKVEKAFRIPFDTTVVDILESPFKPFTGSQISSRSLRVCVPDEWYRRSRSRSHSSVSTEPSEDTVRRLEDLQESESESEEGDGTAKQKASQPQTTASETPDWRSSISQNRLSSLFESWINPATPNSQSTIAHTDKKLVSEPKLVAQHTGGSLKSVDQSSDESVSGLDGAKFEEMLDSLGLKGPKREAMYQLPIEQKQYLFQQHRAASVSKSTTTKRQINHVAQASTYSFASANTVASRIAPQSTGDSGIWKRFSIAGWGAASTSPSNSPRTSADLDSSHSIDSTEDITMASPLQPQTTGGLWSNWWASSGGEKGATSGDKTQQRDLAKTPPWYVDGIRRGKTTDMKLVKHLISLRVHLSTADLVWIEEFVSAAKGMDTLGTLLTNLVAKDGKRNKLQNVEETVLLEVIKCIRVLLNTDFGFRYGISSPTLTTHLAYSLHASSTKLRALTSDVLAAICYVSPTDGHKAVLSAFSEYRIQFGEVFRFKELINSLRLPGAVEEDDTSKQLGYSNEEEGVWEARTASLALINALTNFPDSLEERILLREEFTRRGLNEMLVALRYVRPPDSITTQLDIYTEEKFEDEEDLRERSLAAYRRNADPLEATLEEFVKLAKKADDIYPSLMEAFGYLRRTLERESEPQMRADIVFIICRFLEYVSTLADTGDGWQDLVKQFSDSIRHIVAGIDKTLVAAGHESVVVGELESLRVKVDELIEERSHLRGEVEQHAAELNTLRVLAPSSGGQHNKAVGKDGTESPQNLHGLVQRLVQKEKQVLQLQSELERYKVQNPIEDKEAEEKARRERDRAKWNSLTEETMKLRSQVGELEAAVSFKDKEVIYLKRALESVYSRFRSREESRDAEMDAQQIANRAIESITEKDDEIARLTQLVEDLKQELTAKPKFITEQEYKHQVAPPPPPPGKAKRSATVTAVQSEQGKINLLPPLSPSPPPPPPPPAPQSVTLPVSSSSWPPPPPPPPPPAPRSVTLPVSSPSWPPPPPPPPALPPAPHHHDASATLAPPAPPAPPPPPPLLSAASGAAISSSSALKGGLPPPPPPSAFNMSHTKAIKPTKRLKPFFWTKLSTTTTRTVWDESGEEIPIDLTDLEAAFAMDSPSTSTSQITVTARKRAALTTLLDITRSQNVAIMLARIKLDLPAIRKALLEVDDEKLTVEELLAINKHLPNQEEITRIKDFGDVSKLAKADQYFSEIMTIPKLAERVECMLYRRKLEVEIEEVRPELNIVRNASQELRSSVRFRKVLLTVLTVGNVLNGSTFRGGAKGFQLNALNKLKETRTANGAASCPTLLHYLARVLLRTDPALIVFIEDMPHLEAAARVSVQTVIASVRALSTGLSQLENEVRNIQRMPKLPNDRFVTVMHPFVKQVRESVDALNKMTTSLDVQLNSLLIFFGESLDSPESPKPEEFFGSILTFSTSLQKAALEVHDAQPPSQVNVSPPEVEVSPSTPTQESTVRLGDGTVHSLLLSASQGQASGLSLGRGDLDQAIRSMRDGRRRARPHRPVSKIFVDGARASRIYD